MPQKNICYYIKEKDMLLYQRKRYVIISEKNICYYIRERNMFLCYYVLKKEIIMS